MKVIAEKPVKVNGVWHQIGDVFEMPDELYSQASSTVRMAEKIKKPPTKKKQPAKKQDNGLQDINEMIQVACNENAKEEPDKDGEEDDDA